MAEYIDRQAALDALCDGTFEDAEMSIRSIPAADVAPVLHAKWEKISKPDEDGNVWYRCPICLHNDKQSPGIDVPYCWYCGARMDGTEVTDERSE